MSITLPTEGFLISSGTHKDYKDLFINAHKRRGVYKALNTIIVRLSLLLKLDLTESNNQLLNDLYTKLCYDDDIIFIAPLEPTTPIYNLIALFKQSLQTENPIAFIHSRVSFTPDRSKLIFNI